MKENEHNANDEKAYRAYHRVEEYIQDEEHLGKEEIDHNQDFQHRSNQKIDR